MSDEIETLDAVEFDEVVQLALAESTAAAGVAPSPDVRRRLMARVREATEPSGFAFIWRADDNWMPHPVPGIKMKVLALNKRRGYATLLLDVQPGTRFPAHHHGGAEECYVVSGSLFTCGRRLGPGDFVHADSDTDHGELWTEEGCQVILVVPPEEHLPPSLLA
jgi:anti-sigma factor ChrR (cupin superfamily)